MTVSLLPLLQGSCATPASVHARALLTWRACCLHVTPVVKLPKGTEATMYWFYDRMTVLQVSGSGW